MRDQTLAPTEPRASYYNIDPKTLQTRAAELPGMRGVRIADLFPDSPLAITTESRDAICEKVRTDTLAQLANVDLSKIQPGDSVNVLASHHGFSIFGGEAYAEMIRTVRDEVQRRCRTQNIRLCVGVGMRFREADEYIKKFELDQYFKGKANSICPVDEGVPIATEIGTLYGIRRAYSAKWVIHTHNNDVRELHYHRQIGRLFKPFAMSYATIETRSSYHQSMGPRASNMLPRMIFESPYVQSKFVCSVILQVAPTGTIGVSARNDLRGQDIEFARLNLRWYGKIITLLSKVKEAVVVIDYPGPFPYTTAGGILFGNFLNATIDEFDLDFAFTPFNRYMDMLYPGQTPLYSGNLVPPPNPAIKALVINYCSKGYPGTFFAQQLPTLVVGAQAELIANDEQNTTFMNFALKVDDLQRGVDFARHFAKTPNVMIFDGAVGGINVSESLADELHRMAPAVSEEVDDKLMPLWLEQRGISVS
ncbi:MAG: hypothetical protein ABSD13_11345 [Candidatus Korobacteraceae bacterium]|jgi:hypothetical protein